MEARHFIIQYFSGLCKTLANYFTKWIKRGPDLPLIIPNFCSFFFSQQTAYFIAHMMRHIFCNLLDALMKQTFRTNLTRRSSIFNSSYLCHRHFAFSFLFSVAVSPVYILRVSHRVLWRHRHWHDPEKHSRRGKNGTKMSMAHRREPARTCEPAN